MTLEGHRLRTVSEPVRSLGDAHSNTPVATNEGEWEVQLELNGIGDVLSIAPSLAGLEAEHPGVAVTLVVRPHLRDWASLCWPRVSVSPSNTGRRFRPNMDERAELELKYNCSRHLAYGRALGCTPKRIDLRIPASALEAAETELARHKRPLALLAPFSAYSNRQWPLMKWLRLEDKLRDLGYGIIVIDGPGDGSRLRDFLSTFIWGHAPPNVAALVRGVDVVVGNDSGIAHLAGTLGVPAVAVAGPTSGVDVFSWYPSVRVLQAPLACSPCYWRHASGYRRSCATHCDVISHVSVDAVISEMLAGATARPLPSGGSGHAPGARHG